MASKRSLSNGKKSNGESNSKKAKTLANEIHDCAHLSLGGSSLTFPSRLNRLAKGFD